MMEDTYLRKDVYDAHMGEIRAMMAASEARTAALIAENNAKLEVYRAESKRESNSLASDIRAIKDRLESIENKWLTDELEWQKHWAEIREEARQADRRRDEERARRLKSSSRLAKFTWICAGISWLLLLLQFLLGLR